MTTISVSLGDADRLTQLYSCPNVPGSGATLSDTILHWFQQTLDRDGYVAQGVSASARQDGSSLVLDISAAGDLPPGVTTYQTRLPSFLANGAAALFTDIPAIKTAGLWDPTSDGWRFMLPLGMAMVNPLGLQLFHYPPMNLLNPSQDYLNDAVPARWTELLEMNGAVDLGVQQRLNVVIDSAPIAASDDQGTNISPTVTPTDFFKNYQLAQLTTLLTPSALSPAYSIPLMVYGAPARGVFSELFGVSLAVNQAATVEIVSGLTTPVLAANHPYYFYAQAQGFKTVGSGKLLPANCAGAQKIMVQDLIAAGWQLSMAFDPTQDPASVLKTYTTLWTDPSFAAIVCTLVQHQASLFYPTGNPATFTFQLSIEAAAEFCLAHNSNPCAAAAPA
jgi:hypothetical protein